MDSQGIGMDCAPKDGVVARVRNWEFRNSGGGISVGSGVGCGPGGDLGFRVQMLRFQSN